MDLVPTEQRCTEWLDFLYRLQMNRRNFKFLYFDSGRVAFGVIVLLFEKNSRFFVRLFQSTGVPPNS